jgi:hypothetical protein
VTFIDDDELRCTVSVRLSLREEALTLLACLHLLSEFVSELLAELLALLLAAQLSHPACWAWGTGIFDRDIFVPCICRE